MRPRPDNPGQILNSELPCAKSTGRLDAPQIYDLRRFIPAAETAGMNRFEYKDWQIGTYTRLIFTVCFTIVYA